MKSSKASMGWGMPSYDLPDPTIIKQGSTLQTRIVIKYEPIFEEIKSKCEFN